MRRRAWLVYVLFATAGTAVYYSTGHISYVFNAIGASSPILILVAARWQPKGRRAPWYLFALGQALFIGGDIVAYNYDKFFGTPLPYPSLGDALYLAVYPCLILGLTFLIRARRGKDDDAIIDSLMVAIGVGTLSWIFLIAPYFHDPTLPIGAKLVSIAYPLMDLMLITVALRLAVGAGHGPFAFGLIVASVLSLFVTDAVYGWLLLHQGYTPGSGLLEMGWIAFYVLFGCAALHPSADQLALRETHVVSDRSRWRPMIFGAVAFAAPITTLVRVLKGHELDLPLLLCATIALFALAMVRLFRLISERTTAALRAEALQEQLAHQAFHDSLTALANRSLFRDRVQHALERTRRDESRVSVLFLDLDDFKAVNDSLGHAAGDELLRQVAGRVSGGLRVSDTAARLGGDEFAILLEEEHEVSDSIEVAERLLHLLAPSFRLEDKEVLCQASIGIAIAEGDHVIDADELLRNADVAMYLAKEKGKARYQLFEVGMQAATLRRLELKAEIQQSLDRGEFVLHYQPVINLATSDIIGFEALLRWRHPTRGILPPNDFIPIAEQTGLIVPLGNWVLEEAAQFARQLQEETGRHLHVAVNLSARQLAQPDIAMQVGDVLQRTGLDPSLLTLEITESVMMHEVDLSIVRLVDLKGLGVSLAIDDFGTGYSSLNYVRRFPVDMLKVDKSFIDGVAREGQEAALTAAVVEIAHVLGLTPVAEGIEEPSQLHRLRDLRCELGQGFLFARPMPADEFRQLLVTTMNGKARAPTHVGGGVL